MHAHTQLFCKAKQSQRRASSLNTYSVFWISQSHSHAQYVARSENFWRATWQTEWKTAPLAKVQCEYENQTLEALSQPAVCMPCFSGGLSEMFTFRSRSTTHGCETGFYMSELFRWKRVCSFAVCTAFFHIYLWLQSKTFLSKSHLDGL